MENDIVIYTDGGCSGNPGPGGWACVILADGNEIQLSGGEKLTTNNKMELTAAISALSQIAENQKFKDRPVSLYSDSQYVKNGITSWITNWKKNGWMTSAKKPVLNQDLWRELLRLCKTHNVLFVKVKGHSDNELNNLCDKLATGETAKHI